MKTARSIACAFAAGAGLLVSGCATTGGPLTTEQKIGRCIAMVGAGAVIGGIIGNNTGSGSAQDGIVAGAAVGGGACAVWLGFQNAADRERMLAAQQSAVATGAPQRASWVGADGRSRTVAVSALEPQTVVDNTEVGNASRICRRVNTTATVDGANDTISEIWCRGANNEWAPAEDQTILV